MHTRQVVYLLLGSNVGDRQQYMRSAIASLSGHLKIIRTSPIYETSAWGKTAQRAYLNQVVETSTTLGPFRLLHLLNRIEKQFGRTGKGLMLPRQLDIDILLYNSTVVSAKHLRIPHPRISQRRFVLTPLAELIPHYIHPAEEITIKEMLERCEDKGTVRKFDPAV